MTLAVVSFDVMKIHRRTNRRMLIKTTGVVPIGCARIVPWCDWEGVGKTLQGID